MIYIRDCEKDNDWSLTHILKKFEKIERFEITHERKHIHTETTAPTHTHKKFSRAKPQDL